MSEDRVGSTLAGKYRVERRLGEGGMGVVFEATHTALGHRVAVKLLAGHRTVDDTMRARFEREAKIAAKLSNEHIVRVSDVGTLEDGTPFMVMDLLAGEDLASLLARAGRLSVPDAVDFVLEVCDALADAHAAGIVHRDLKPSNLFVTTRRNGSPCLKVLDFGISKMSDDANAAVRTQTHDILGSPRYMSPEQITSTSSVDARSDIWSLGVVLFELLTARAPFEAPTLFELQVAITSGAPNDLHAFRPDVPPGLAAIVARMLARARDQRFPDVLALAEALEPYASARGREIAHGIRVATGRHGVAPVTPPPSTGGVLTVTVEGPPGGRRRAPPPADELRTTAPFATSPAARKGGAGRTAAVVVVSVLALGSLGAAGLAGKRRLVKDVAAPPPSVTAAPEPVAPIAAATSEPPAAPVIVDASAPSATPPPPKPTAPRPKRGTPRAGALPDDR